MTYLKHAKAILFFFCTLFLQVSLAASLNTKDSHQAIEKAIRTQLKKPEGALSEKDYLSIKYLNLSDLGLSDIAPLHKAKSLQTLLLSNNHIHDLSTLKDLPLIKLIINNNMVKDISPLQTMNKLSVIYLSNNQVQDPSPLFERPFKRAILSGNPLNPTQVPQKLEKKVRYRYLDNEASNNLIEKILREKVRKPTGELTSEDYAKVTTLALNNLGLSDISPLEKCKNLKMLNLHMNEIHDLTPLAGLTQLTQLNLGSNNIDNIDALKELIHLESLIIYINHIEDLSPLAQMKNITFLSAYENKIKEVKSLHHLKSARKIKLHDNPIPLEQQKQCHENIPNVELMFKTGLTKNYYNSNQKKS